ncbi:MAG: DUF362 domain-containing protein [Candidatus Saganbacteria bacterium]|nr:DUF362 domain-containing protein [Candidatus Saganbacteria bacterium]
MFFPLFPSIGHRFQKFHSLVIEEKVEKALREAFDALGGIATFIKPGNKVLLKVNALQSAKPEQAATTHPAIVKIVAKLVKEAGGIPLVGDSPGDARAHISKVLEVTGIKKAAEEAGAEILEFQKENLEVIKSPSGSKCVPLINISKVVLNADVIINLPKLKTHGFTLFTGAIKNLYGCVPGFNKALYHFQAARLDQFAQLIVDIYEIVKPTLNIMDGITAMEGDGPGAGDPKHVGALLVSTDAVAMDAVAAALVGYKPKEIPITEEAAKRKLGISDLSKIIIEGESIASLKVNDFKKARKNIFYILHYMPVWLRSILFPVILALVWVKPEIIQEKCTKCGTCIRSCPTHTIHQKHQKVKVDPKKCIMCFCCQELCEYKAIRLKASVIAKLIGVGQ